MTPHQSVLAQILASFEDEGGGALPIEEVEADLHVLGVDPAASIARATRLASKSRSPGARRLREVEPGDAADAAVLLPAAGALAKEKQTQQLPLSGGQASVDSGHQWRTRFHNILGRRRARTRPVVRLRMAIAACIPLLFFGGAAVYLSRVSPTYEAQALVMLNEGERRAVPGLERVVPGLVPNDERLEILLVRSRRMAERLANELNLHLLPEFNPAIRPKTGSLTSLLDPARLVPPAIFELIPRAWPTTLNAPFPVELTDQQQADLLRAEIIENVLRNIRAEAANRPTVLTLKFQSVDPSVAALGANKLAELYLTEQLESKQSASRRDRTFLEREIASLRQDVVLGEQALQTFRREHDLIGLAPQRASVVSMTEVATAEMAVRAQLQAAEARLRQVESLLSNDVDLESAAGLLDSPILTALLAREIELNREIARLSQDFGERRPQMVSLRAEQAALQDRKRLEIQQIAHRQRNEVQSLRESIRALEHRSQERAEHVAELERLEREVQAKRDLLGTYLDRQQEIISLERAQQPHARIISRAVLPAQPIYPRRGLIVGIALFGALLSCLLLFPQTFLRRSGWSGPPADLANTPGGDGRPWI
jgi:polysaccharide biosynthesis transport protein